MLLCCLLCFTLYLISQFWTQTTLFKCISPIYCPYNIAYHGSHIHSQKLPAVDLPRVCDRATPSCLKNLKRYRNRNWKWSCIRLWRPLYFGRDRGYSEQANEGKSLQEQLTHRAVYSAKVPKTKAWQVCTARAKSKEEPGSPSQTDLVPALPVYAATPARPVPRKMLQTVLLSHCRAFKRSSTTMRIFGHGCPFFSPLHSTMMLLLLAWLKNLKLADLKGGIWGGRWGAGKWKGKQGSGVGWCFQAAFFPLLPNSLFPLSPLQITPANPCQLPCWDLGLPVCPNHMSLQICPLVTFFPFHFPAFLLHTGILY